MVSTSHQKWLATHFPNRQLYSAALEDILEPLTSELTNQAKNRDLYWI